MIRGYLRVSTGRQADEGYSLDAQHETIASAAKRNDWGEVVWYRDEGRSGKSLDRPKVRQLLADIQHGDTLVAAKLDRLTRSVLDFSDLVRRAQTEGWNLIVLDQGFDLSTPYGRAWAQMAAVFAELQRELIVDNVRTAHAQRRREGKFSSGGDRPFGWADRSYSAIMLSEAKEIRAGARSILAGATAGDIARDWTEREVPGQWTNGTVKRLYRRPTLAGLTSYQGEVVGQGEFPAILDEDTWRSVVSALNNGTPKGEGYGARTHELAGYVYCELCGSLMVAQGRSEEYTKRNGNAPKFACVKGRGGCGRVTRNMEWLNNQIDALMREMLAQVPDEDNQQQHDYGETIESLEEEIREARRRWMEGSLGREDYYATVAELREEINRLKTQQMRQVPDMTEHDESPLSVWKDRSQENLYRRRALLSKYIDKIMIKPVGKGYGRKPLPPESIDVVLA